MPDADPADPYADSAPPRRPITLGWALLLMCVGVAAGGCGSQYGLLPTEQSVPEFAALAASAGGLPQRTSLVPVGAAGGRPVRVAVHETGTGDRGRVVVFVHGVLSDSRMWRFVRGDLGRDFDLMAVDLTGCGESDRPDPADRGPDGYAPPALARDVLLAVRGRLAERDAADAAAGRPKVRLTLGGHSLGGMVILRMWADDAVRAEYADVLGRVDGLVLFTPADVMIDPALPTFHAVATATDSKVVVADALGVLREKVAAGIRDSVSEERLAVREEADRLVEVLRDPPRRRAAIAMLRRALPLTGPAGDRLDWDRAEAIEAGYARVDVPCLIVWGGRDETFPVSMGYKLAAELPGGRLRIVTAGRHCLPTERPAACIRLVRQFVEEGGMKDAPRISRVDVEVPPAAAAGASTQASYLNPSAGP